MNTQNQFQMQGIKRKRRCEPDCKDHIFQVQGAKNHNKYDIKLSFCPKFQREPLPAEHTYPEYNDDAKFFTSAFILGVDKRVLMKNEQQELMDHQKQIRQSLQKNNQLIFPRPNSKHSLCSVCKENYKNYYFHIASFEHRDKINLNFYNNHINDLCNIYRHLWEGAEERADEEEERRQQLFLLSGNSQQIDNQTDPKNNFDEEAPQDDYQNMDIKASLNMEEGEIEESINFMKQVSKSSSKRTIQKSFNQQDTVPLPNHQKKLKRVNSSGTTSQYQSIKKKIVISNQEVIFKRESKKGKERDSEDIELEKNFHSKNQLKRDQQKNRLFQLDKSDDIMQQLHREMSISREIAKSKEKDKDHLEFQRVPMNHRPAHQFLWKRQQFKSKEDRIFQDHQKNQRDEKINKIENINENHQEGTSQQKGDGSHHRHNLYRHSSHGPYPHGATANTYENHHERGAYQRDYSQQKQKSRQKIDYNQVYYPPQWPYPPHPYYYQQMMPPSMHQIHLQQEPGQYGSNPQGKGPHSHLGPNPYLGNTSININVNPMMMYPHSMGYPIPNNRYPMPMMPNPYMSYSYPYMHQQPINPPKKDSHPK